MLKLTQIDVSQQGVGIIVQKLKSTNYSAGNCFVKKLKRIGKYIVKFITKL